MKIGILTFHKGYNHGGFFQALGTLRFLQKNGYNVEVIDYVNKHHHTVELLAMLKQRNPFVLFKNIHKMISFKRDFKTLNFSKSISKRNISELKKYDAVIIGSDIVWNYEWDFLGSDPIYFGEYFSDTKLISYAPSFGNVKYSETMDLPEWVVSGLNRFEHLSVRDDNSLEIVKLATGKAAQLVIDPAFLLAEDDLTVKNVNIKYEKFVLIYAYQINNQQIKEVKEFAKKKGLITISVGYFNQWCDINKTGVGPYEWLEYIRKASYVVTSTFHGTLFSVILKTPMVTIPTDAINNKLKTILEISDLSDRILSDESSVELILSSKLDFNEIYQAISPFIRDSKNYLLDVLK